MKILALLMVLMIFSCNGVNTSTTVVVHDTIYKYPKNAIEDFKRIYSNAYYKSYLNCQLDMISHNYSEAHRKEQFEKDQSDFMNMFGNKWIK